MEEVRCENCGNMTYNLAYCTKCGKPLHEGQITSQSEVVEEQQKKDEYGFHRRAFDADKNQRGLAIARFQVLPQAADGLTPPVKKIAVQRNHRMVVFTPTTREPKVLGPGQYSVANLLLTSSSSSEASRRPAAELWKGICLCEVSLLPIPAMFVLPDWAALGENADVTTALNSLGLITADNLLGGAQVQMSLRCINPQQLVQTFTADQIGKGRIEVEQIVPRPRERPNLLARWWRRVFRDGEPEEDDANEEDFLVRGEIENYTIAQLYSLIRLELATSIRTSISNEPVSRLSVIDVRTRIEKDIQTDLERTLKSYGMEIETGSVSAFQFFSPDYMRLRSRRARTAIDGMELEDKQTAATIRIKGRVIEQADIMHSGVIEEEIKRHELKQRAQTSLDNDEIELAKQKRVDALDSHRRAHDREERAADVRKDVEVQFDKGKKMVELHNLWQDAEMKRQKEMIKEYAALKTDQLLTIAMIQNPQLAAAFVAAKQAEGQQQRLEQEQTFRKQLVELILEATKQVGNVAARRVEADRPQSAPMQVVDIPSHPSPKSIHSEE